MFKIFCHECLDYHYNDQEECPKCGSLEVEIIKNAIGKPWCASKVDTNNVING